MRERAPAVQEWVARLWNTSLERITSVAAITHWPSELSAIFAIVADEFLPYMQANEKAWANGQKKFEFMSETVRFKLPVHSYRAWRYQRLRQHFQSLAGHDQKALADLPERILRAMSEPIKAKVPPAIEELPIKPAQNVNKGFKPRTW